MEDTNTQFLRPRGFSRLWLLAGIAGAVAVLIIASIVFIAQQKPDCPSNNQNVCRAIANWPDRQYQARIRVHNKGNPSTGNLQVDSTGKHVRYFEFSSSSSYQVILDDALTYTRDPSDQKWWKQTAKESDIETYKQSILPFGGLDLSSKDFSYKMTGRLTCPNNNLTCHRFEVTHKDQAQTAYIIWFDIEQFLIRHIVENKGATGKEYQIEYEDIGFSPPNDSLLKNVPKGQKIILGNNRL